MQTRRQKREEEAERSAAEALLMLKRQMTLLQVGEVKVHKQPKDR
jgi:hypothetical protein